MKCPNCGSENCQYVATTETHGKSFSVSNACCGSILLGPIGVLCGACGTGVQSKTHEYWICNTCGRRFNQYEANKIMENEAQKIDRFVFYCIFRKNRALAPHERSAVPLGTDHCPVC